MENYKLYIPTTKRNVKLKFTISYLKPSESRSWSTGETRETGYRVNAIPVEITDNGNGYQMESWSAFSGFGDTLVVCKRRSSKRYEEAKKVLEKNLPKYIDWFKARGYVIDESVKQDYDS